MGKCLIKLKDKYFEWSTISDAPTTYAMSIEELRKYIKRKYGEEGLKDLPDRLKRVEEKGTSAFDNTLEEILYVNRAGEEEECISKKAILKKYTKGEENEEFNL